MAKLLWDPLKFRDFLGSSVGVVVTLEPPEGGGGGGDPLVVVGACAAVERPRATPELSVAGLGSPDWESSVSRVLQHYPAGTRAGGVWVRVEEEGEQEQSRINLIVRHTKLKEVFENWPILVLAVWDTGDNVTVRPYQLDQASELTPMGGVAPADPTVGRYLAQHTVLLRVSASLPLYIISNNIQKPVASLVQRIRRQSSSFLLSPEQLLFSERSKDSLRSVLPEKYKAASKTVPQNSTHMAHSRAKPQSVEILESTAPEDDTELPPAPSLRFGGALKEGCVLVVVPVDTLALVRWDSTLGSIAQSLKDRICAQLEAIKEEMLWKADALHNISVHHFTLDSQDCPVTLAFPNTPLAPPQASGDNHKSLTNRELQTLRTKWKNFFGIPSKSLQLRILSRRPTGGELDWIASHNTGCPGQQLLNPHLPVKHTRVQGGTMGLVRGNYLYYHYMQEGFNDNGWGCAYRSLQTLWSWFVLQGYTDSPVPTHQQIQETLVKVGDKEQHFIGSKEWIGSFEVGTVLDQLLGIQYKIHHTSSGGDMASAGRVLLSHFQTEGTPVMIGGGVLAHTILGVDFNTSTGEIQFLILDPHYTGREDMKTILDKGWCGWKPLTFWDSTAHYNMCMPQVPED